MAAPNGRIQIDWKQALSADASLELEIVDSSSPITMNPPMAAHGDTDEGSAGDGGGAAEFTDEKLREKIWCWRYGNTRSLLAATPDGGDNMRIRINRIEKEVASRQLARQRKGDADQEIMQAKLTGISSNDPYTFNTADELPDNVAEKSQRSPCSTSSVKDVVVDDDDDDDDTAPATARLADIEMSNKWDESRIYYPSRNDPGADELTYSDMKCLEPEEFLKSPIINFYITYLKKSRPRGDFYMFNTYFYCKLKEALSSTGDRDSRFRKLRRWLKGADIFKKAYIVLPINEMMHWSLIIVCMPTKETNSGPIMLHLDSLGLHPSQKLFDIVASYLKAEWHHLQKESSYDIPFSRKIWSCLPRSINQEKVEVPRQRNGYDCGLFMLYYIDKCIQEAPERLTKENLGMYFGRKWFNHEEASRLRQGIRALLFDVFQSAHEDDSTSQSGSHSGDYPGGEDKDTETVMVITLDDE